VDTDSGYPLFAKLNSPAQRMKEDLNTQYKYPQKLSSASESWDLMTRTRMRVVVDIVDQVLKEIEGRTGSHDSDTEESLQVLKELESHT